MDVCCQDCVFKYNTASEKSFAEYLTHFKEGNDPSLLNFDSSAIWNFTLYFLRFVLYLFSGIVH